MLEEKDENCLSLEGKASGRGFWACVLPPCPLHTTACSQAWGCSALNHSWEVEEEQHAETREERLCIHHTAPLPLGLEDDESKLWRSQQGLSPAGISEGSQKDRKHARCKLELVPVGRQKPDKIWEEKKGSTLSFEDLTGTWVQKGFNNPPSPPKKVCITLLQYLDS